MDPGLGARITAMGLYRRAGAGAERGARGSYAYETQVEDSRGRIQVTVVVTNSRKADLVQLQATESGLVSWKRVLGALKSGNHAPAQLPHPFNCRVDLHGTFSDGQSMDATDVDVCAQKTLNLTD